MACITLTKSTLPNVFRVIAFPCILVTYAILALAFSVTIPLGEAPDEVSHWSYVQYLIAEHRLPSPEGAVLGESHQPPLYYLIGALATYWVPHQGFQAISNPDFVLDDPQTPNLLLHTRRETFPYQGIPLAWHLVRVLSVVMGAVTVWVTWRLASEVFPDERWISLGSVAFVAFLPEFVFISAVVNNDNLVVMLSNLSVRQIFRMTQQPLQIRNTALLGILLGLATLTKLSGLVLWLFAAIAIVFLTVRNGTWRRDAIYCALCFGIAFAIIAPWVIYNLQRYGDPFGWSFILSVTPVRQVPMTFNDWVGTAQGLFTSFWGRFGGALQIKMSNAVYMMLGIAGILALAGWTGYVRDTFNHKLTSGMRTFLLLFILLWLLMLAAHVRWTLAVLGTDQARQLFPGLPLLSIFLAAGLARLFVSNKKLHCRCGVVDSLRLRLPCFFISIRFTWYPRIIGQRSHPLVAPKRQPILAKRSAFWIITSVNRALFQAIR